MANLKKRANGATILARATSNEQDESPAITVIIIAPTGSAGLFSVALDSTVIVKSSRQPRCDAARVLRALGHPDNTLIISFREGTDEESMRGSLGKWLRLRVREDGTGPRFANFEPFPTRGLSRRQNSQPAEGAPESRHNCPNPATGGT